VKNFTTNSLGWVSDKLEDKIRRRDVNELISRIR
jgi:hypothetical protein